MKVKHILGTNHCILIRCLTIFLSFVMLMPSLGAFCSEVSEFYPVDIRYSSATVDKQPLDSATYDASGATYKVSNIPTPDEKSLMVVAAPGDTFSVELPVGKTKSSNLVIETSIAYRGTLSTQKELFTLEYADDKTVTLLTMDEQGTIKTIDNKPIYRVKKNYFYRVSVIFDFLRQEYQVKVNNQHRARLPFPETFDCINSAAFTVKGTLLAGEETYFKYFRVYEGDILTNDTYKREPKIADNSTFEVKPIPVPTEDEILTRNAGVVYVTSKTPRARVYGTLRLIDSSNPDLTPLYIDKCLLLPSKFGAEILNATLEEAGNTITFSNPSTKIVFTVGSPLAYKNGEEISLKTVPVNKDGITFVPSDALCSAFGYTSDTVNETTITAITKKGQEFDFDITADWKIFSAATRQVIYEQPTTEEIVNLFNEKTDNFNHPRIMLTPEKVEDLKVKIQREPYKSWYQNILNSANGHLTSGVPNLKYETTDGTRMHHGSNCKDPLVTVGLAYQLTGDIKYAEYGADVLMALCDTEIFPDWHPWHFLDVAHTAESVAIGFDWCYDGLTEEEKAHIVQVSRKYALEEVMKDYLELPRERTWAWSSKSSAAYPQNWSEICPMAMTMLSLAIGDEPSFGDQTIIGDCIREGLERMRDVQETFGPDGIYVDGFSYWNYATNVKVQGIESMFTTLGKDFGSINAVGLRGTFDYIMYEDGPNGGANFGPNESTHQMSGLFHWAANRFNAPEYTIYCNDMLELRGGSGGWMHFIWYDDSLVGGEKAQIKQDMRSRYLPRLYFRQGFDDYDTWMAIYAGGTGSTTNGGSEQHGTYIVDMLGERWACDTGKEQGNYTGKLIRIKYYRNRAEGHNVILVNPGLDYNTNYNAPCSFDRMEADDYSTYAIYDYTQKYAFKGCTSYKRGFRLDKEYGNVLIQDEYKASKLSEFYWFMHTEGNIEIARDGKSATIEKNNKKVLVNIVSPDKSLRFTKMAAVPLETSPQRTDSEESPNDKYQKLVIHTENVKEVNLAVEMTPLYATTPGYLNEEYVPLSEWELYEQRLDKSLKLTSISVDGKPLDGFDPDKTRYSYHFPYNKIRGEVIATSDNATVEVSEATLGNHLTRITLTAKDGSGRKNEYIIASQPYDYNELRGFNINADYINELPPDSKVVENVTVSAEYVPQPSNNPGNMLDGDILTRFSHDHRDEYAEFDLGDNYEITYLGVGHPFGTRSEYFRLEVSTDGKNWRTIMDRGTQIIGKAGLMYFGLEKPETFRYARIYHLGTSVSATKSSWWSISEIEFVTPNK